MKNEWQTRRLEEVCSKITDGSHFSPKTTDAGFPYITVRDIEDDQINFANCKFISAADYSELHKNGCGPHQGDLLFSKDGTVGKVALVDYDREFVVLSSLAIVRPDNRQINPAFLKYVLKSPAFLDEAVGMKTGVAIRRIILRNLKSISIPFPPLAEQQRIVAILDEAFEGIATAEANAERCLKGARELFISYLNRLEGPKTQLGPLVAIRTGKLDANAAVENGLYPFFTCSREVSAINTFAFDCRAVLLAGNNAVGDFNVKIYDGKFNAYQRTYVITIPDESKLSYRYLYFQVLKSMKEFKEMSVGAGTKFLKIGMIQNLPIALPAISVQESTASSLDAFLEQTGNLEAVIKQKMARLDDLKQSLLHQAFTGKL
jgi:type I restriction enzyme S subunit